ncbi:Asp23/Gls24 family envelope stress response protein [Cryobacterium melibiosiphilum]|uniref:Asp23/Gls24 family envelope stress response protein n=1 Tax=Cryobacterium melibiosiphilum TaxID=995039 RepID=A0A3A5MGK8_9MICO|nr:Asp23/Gls24 family envelope stress response protein [Cryobacterium melibiosiphilum]RJT87099.1 Asp23/Gls24 family envelope stress response protein [Cryobacterium melibiosiphilum]
MTHSEDAGGRSVDPVALDADLDIIEVLTDYLDRGVDPPRELLDGSPAHHLALDALVRFRRVTSVLLTEDIAAEPERDDGWVATILANIHSEARAGRSIPLAHPSSIADLSMSEGAVRGLVRAAGDAVSGTLIGACRLEGDVTDPGAPITVAVEASVFWGERIPATAEHIRAAVESALLLHTELNVVAVNVTVTDVHLRRTEQEGR